MASWVPDYGLRGRVMAGSNLHGHKSVGKSVNKRIIPRIPGVGVQCVWRQISEVSVRAQPLLFGSL
jgi:hypothetical protein